jgi:hypothetical protein
MTPTIDRLTRELIASVANLRALYGNATVVPFNRGRARDKVFAASDRLAAELSREFKISAWTPHNPRNTL